MVVDGGLDWSKGRELEVVLNFGVRGGVEWGDGGAGVPNIFWWPLGLSGVTEGGPQWQMCGAGRKQADVEVERRPRRENLFYLSSSPFNHGDNLGNSQFN